MRKLLLADDSITIQRVIELTFSGEDVQVVAVGDGEQAIQRIPTEKPDIVLADIGMPKRNGYEVAEFVKQHAELSSVPVLLLAGAFEPVDEARARQVKADGVLVKPFEPQQVIARVRELLDGGKAPAAKPSAPEPVTPTAVAPVPVPEPRVAVPEPELSRPEIGVASAAPADASLDDYFDRLDAAFATLGTTPGKPEPPPPILGDDVFSIPTVDDVLSAPAPSLDNLRLFGRIAPPPPEPPETSATLAPAPAAPVGERTGGERGALADVFDLLFAIERGEAEPNSLRIGAAPPAPAPAPKVEITDELVGDITERVLARLAPDTARDLVRDIVSEIAERLIREEIARIKNSK